MQVLLPFASFLLAAATLLPALEDGQILQHFLLDPESQEAPTTYVASLTITSPAKPLPLILTGTPTAGAITLVRPMGKNILAMAREAGEAADLLGFGDFAGQAKVTFGGYNGDARSQQLGTGLFRDQPEWQLHIERIDRSAYLSNNPDLQPSAFARPQAGDYDNRQAPSGKWPILVFSAHLHGRLQQGQMVHAFSVPARIRIQDGTSYRTYRGDSYARGESAQLYAIADIPVPAAMLREEQDAVARLWLWAYSDIKAGTGTLRQSGPQRVELGQPARGDDDIASELGF